MRIRTRIFLCVAVLIAAGFYYLVQWILDDLRPRYLEAMEESLVDTAALLASCAEQSLDNGTIGTNRLQDLFDRVHQRKISAQIYEIIKESVDVRVYITDTKGIVIFDSSGKDTGLDYSKWNDVYLTLKGEYGARATRTDPDDPTTSVLYIAAPIRDGDQLAGVLTVGKPTVSSNLFIAAAKRKIVLAAVIAAAAVGILALTISFWVTQPLDKLTRYAKAVRDGKAVSPPRLGATEIGVAGQAIQEMKEALEGKAYVERYVQTLTHELKAPLAAIEGAAELLNEDMPREQRSRFLDNIRSETQRTEQIIQRLLQLSALEKRETIEHPDPINLPTLLHDIVTACHTAAQARNQHIELAAGPNLPDLPGDRELLFQAIRNLLYNAIDFAPNGTRITLTAEQTGNQVLITVSDEGPGIPDYALSRIFERFYSLPRPDTGRKSSGLGLAIVQRVATMHRGTITLTNRPERGTIAQLTLPC